ncbi:MAG: carbon storage regulator [Oscillospiraceae bacterium]|nr:carbon storage regulator [Oscillospiraceae bacterium]
MLVITRKTEESFVIETVNGEKIEVIALESGKDRVKLGVKAPREVKIIRSELLLAETSNVEASQAVSKDVLNKLYHFSPKK